MSFDASNLPGLVLHDEGGLIVVDKPAGLASTGRSLDDPDCLQWHLARWARRKVWAVHQLDKQTSGVNLFVRRKALVAEWQRILGERRTRKVYLALTHGRLQPGRLTVDEPIGWVDALGRRAVTPDGQPSRSHVEVLDHTASASLVCVTIETGRTHQVRIHLAHLGHPLLGEDRYRDPPCRLHSRQALHAWRLETPHAPDQAFVAQPPADLERLAAEVGLKWAC